MKTSYTQRDANKVVAQGVKLLDQFVPGWAHRINLRELDLGDCDACMLGQLYGMQARLEGGVGSGFSLGRRTLWEGHIGTPIEALTPFSLLREFSEAHGFDVPYNTTSADLQTRYLRLRTAWVAAVKKARARKAVTRG